MDDIQVIIDIIKVVFVTIAAMVLLISFVTPLFGTYIPYWKRHGRPSLMLTTRILARFFFLAIVVYEALFPLNRLIGFGIENPRLIVISIPLFTIYSALLVFNWFKHPDGIRGL